MSGAVSFQRKREKETLLPYLLKGATSSQRPLDVEDEIACRCEAQ